MMSLYRGFGLLRRGAPPILVGAEIQNVNFL